MKTKKTNTSSRPVDRAQERRVQYLTDYHPEWVKLFRHAYQGDSGPRACIKAFCLECNGWDEPAIAHCSCTVCQLWPHRPFQSQTKPGWVPLVQPEAPAIGILPPIVTLDEMEAQLAQQRANHEPEHFTPRRDGFC